MKKILLLLAKGFESYEASVFIDVMGWNLTDGDKSTKLFTCGLSNEIKGSFDFTVKPDYLIKEVNVDEFDILAIPGGFEEYGFYEDAYGSEFLDLIRTFHCKNKIIASICVAALSLGKSGILKSKRATTYKGNRQTQLKEFGAILVDEPIVIEDNIITSWNPSTAVNVAFILLEKLTSKANSEKIRKMMGFSN